MTQINQQQPKKMKMTKSIIGLAVIILLALFTVVRTTKAKDWFTTTIAVDYSLTNIPPNNGISVTSNSIPGGTAFAIPQETQWSLTITNRGGKAGSAVTNGFTTYGFNLSPDGATWTTTLPITLTVTQSGSNTVCVASNYLANAQLPNGAGAFEWGRLDQIVSNQTNGVVTPVFKLTAFQ